MLARANPWSILIAALTALVGSTEPAHARGATQRDPALERSFATQLAVQNPRLGEAFVAATRLLDEGRSADAETAYRAIAKEAPAHAPTLWRLSALLGNRGDRDQAVAFARSALAASEVWQAKSTLASALILDVEHHPDDQPEIKRLVNELEQEHPGADTGLLAGTLALYNRDWPALRDQVATLRQHADDDPRTHYLAFILRASEDDAAGAAQSLARAVDLGFPADKAAEILDRSGIAKRMRAWRWAKIGAVALASWLLGLGAIFLLGRGMSSRTLSAVERFDGRDRGAFRRTTRRLRGAYAWLIGATAIYYYLSVPIVVGIVLLLAGGAVYGALLLGHIPIKLLLVIAFVALISVWAMLRSLVVRRGKDQDPGRPLSEQEAPGLWVLLREVAARAGTRPVDAVYVTLGTEVAVIERGSLRLRLRDAGQRALILGVGVLDGLTRQQLRAVLAHEYGHFSHRDTAGGGLAAIVRTTILASIIRMARSGGAGAMNPAWHFVRMFYAVFLRTTLGASRLQEIMADQAATAAYGAQAFVAGLTHIVRRTVEFDRNVDLLARRAATEARPIASLYARPDVDEDPATKGNDALEVEVKKHMDDPGSPYDSHPPPGKRIAWVSKLDIEPPDLPLDAAQLAWTLFADRDALEREMTAIANQQLKDQGAFEEQAPLPAAQPAAP